MKSEPNSSPGQRWDDLIASARNDQPPSLNLDPVLRAVRSALIKSPASTSWAGDFANLFGARSTLAFCLCTAIGLTIFSTWQLADALPTLSWAELLAVDVGAAS